MSSGAGHFTTAEQLLTSAQEWADEDNPAMAAQQVATAQVHATLALAAATALGSLPHGATDEDRKHWLDVTAPAKRPATPLAVAPFAGVPVR